MKMHFTNIDGYIKINNNIVSKVLNLSKKTIKEAFSILCGYGLIHMKKIGKFNAYRLMEINEEGMPLTIPNYERPKKSKPEIIIQEKNDRAPGGCPVSSTRGVPGIEHQGGARLLVLPIIEEKKNLFKKSVQPLEIQTKPSAESAKAAPDFLKKIELWNSIPIEIRRKLNKKQILTGSIEKIEYSIERMIVAMTSGGNAIAAFQNAFKGDHAKLTRKMEEIEMKKNREHTKDIDILFKKARDRQNIKFQPTDAEISKFVKEFRSVMSPMYDNHSDSAIICLRSFQSCLKNRVTS